MIAPMPRLRVKNACPIAVNTPFAGQFAEIRREQKFNTLVIIAIGGHRISHHKNQQYKQAGH